MPSRLDYKLKQSAVGPVTLAYRRTPNRFLLTANEQPVQ